MRFPCGDHAGSPMAFAFDAARPEPPETGSVRIDRGEAGPGGLLYVTDGARGEIKVFSVAA
jgi:hypothetical protein